MRADWMVGRKEESPVGILWMNAGSCRMTSRTWFKQQKGRQAGEVCLNLQKDAEMMTKINVNSKGMEKDKFGIRDKCCWLDFAHWHVIPVNPRDHQPKRERTSCMQVSWQKIHLLGKDMLWFRKVYALAKEWYSSRYQTSSHKPYDAGHSLRKYHLFSLIQGGENRSWVYTEKGKLDAQKDSKTLNFDKNYGYAGMAREQSYLVNSELNSETEEDTKCIEFKDSLKSMFVRHQRDKNPSK